MSEKANINTVRSFLDGLHNNDKQRMADQLAPDATYWIMPGTSFSGVFDKDGYLQLVDGLFDAQSGHLELDVVDVTAQEDRVAAVVRGHMPLKKGGAYDNTYHWLFKFRDGKIVHVKEFFDTLDVWKAFGTPEQVAVAEATTADAPRMPD